LLHEPTSDFFRPASCRSPAQECRWWVWPTLAGFQNVRYSRLLQEQRRLSEQQLGHKDATPRPEVLGARFTPALPSMARLYPATHRW